jgi:hypothetical protein
VKFSLSGPLALTANKSYFITLNRSGAADANKYYVVRVNQAQNYAAGILRTHEGSAWATYAADMPFRLYTNALVETTQQIRALLVNYGQFLRYVIVNVSSGISTESYRNGDADALAEIEELMDIGDNTGKRLLAMVDAGRNVMVTLETPSSGMTDVSLLRDGSFVLPHGEMIDPTTCPCGFWARLRNVLPGSLDTSVLSGLCAFFVESSEYNVDSKLLTFEPTAKALDISTEVG